eukprot:403377058
MTKITTHRRLIYIGFLCLSLTLHNLNALDLQGNCLGLVLKGGANRGSYEAGVIQVFAENLDPEEVQWDVVSGISVGALNSAHVSSYEKGDEKAMADGLVAMWRNMSSGNLYQSWRFGIAEGLLFRQGLLDNSPLHEFINQTFAKRPCCKRKIHFNSVDANSGNVISFDETTDPDSLIRGLVATTSVPFVFPALKIEDKIMIDGGVAWNLDVASAIMKCREIVDSDAKIVLDIIDVDRFTDRVHRWVRNDTHSTVQNFMRYLELKRYHKRFNDMIEIEAAHPDVRIRYQIIPKVQIDSLYQELSFDKELIEKMIKLGREDAIEAIKNQFVTNISQKKLQLQQASESI